MFVRLTNASHSHMLRRCWLAMRAKLFPPPTQADPVKVCVVVPSFPTMGGILTVLQGIAEVTQDSWQIEYLTQFLESGYEHYASHRFGTRRMTPLYFPFAWLYVVAGTIKLLILMRRGTRYHFLLPQDGIFSAALAGLAGKLAGVPVICIDHGELSLFTPRISRVYREERVAAIATKNWPWFVRFSARFLLFFYWPSRLLVARLAARLVDRYLIPGVPGDSCDEGCRIAGIPPDRVIRFGSMIDLNHHPVPDAQQRKNIRERNRLPVDSIVIAIACRLSAEKGLHIALESIDRALAQLPQNRREQVRVVIAGDGPLRNELEQQVRQRNLEQICHFWGNLQPAAVYELLSISDIFLYTSTRGACMAMAVLEAMAAGCAVIASTEPLANAVLLADGRGIAVPTRDSEQTAHALLRLLGDIPLCHLMGMQARDYIRDHHSPARFKRLLTLYVNASTASTEEMENLETQPFVLQSRKYK
jgi:glycosyltransferase involved in cell wall biosynthesis